MTEKDYWLKLEYRLGVEFRYMPDRRFGGLWCDGFNPEIYSIADAPPRISGRVWIVKDQNQEEWKFELYLPQVVHSLDEIEWDRLLPPIDMTHWLAVDWDRHLIQIEPAAATPDLPKSKRT